MKIRNPSDSDVMVRVGGPNAAGKGKWQALIRRIQNEGPLVVEGITDNERRAINTSGNLQGIKMRTQALKDGSGYLVSIVD